MSSSALNSTLSADSSGTCLIQATIAADGSYNSATSSSTAFTFSKAAQSALTISSTSFTYGETLTLTTSGGSGTGAVTYIKNSGNCTISGTTLTTDAAGSCSVTATKASDTNYLAETSSATTITINPRAIRIKAADRSATYTGSSVSVTNSYSITSGTLASGESITSLTYTYTSIPTGSYSNTTAPTTAGNYTITPSAAVFSPGSSSNYAITYDTATLTIAKASQTITFAPLTPKTLGMDSFTVTATSTSGLAVTFASSNSGICSVSDSAITLVSAGTCTITASQAGNTNYDSATPVPRSFTISSALLITTPSGAGLIATYDSAYTLSLVSSGGATPRTFALISGTLPLGLTLDTATGVISGIPSAAGSSAFTIRVTDSNTATATTSSFTVTVNKAQPLLSSFAISNKTYGDSSFALTAPSVTGSIPGTFTYTSSNASVATISTTTVTITGGGVSTITALFTPTDTTNYETATITATLTVNRASQSPLTITTTSVAFGSTLTLDTDGGSGSGSITYAVSSGSCTISSSTLTPTAVGSCIVVATKAFDTNYLTESSTATIITIVQGSPSATLTFSSTTLTFGITNTLTITASVAGTVRYSANGKVIKSCRARPTSLSSPFIATCSYRPATRRPTTITATLTPTNSGFASRTTISSTFLVGRRTGARG